MLKIIEIRILEALSKGGKKTIDQIAELIKDYNAYQTLRALPVLIKDGLITEKGYAVFAPEITEKGRQAIAGQ